LQKLRNRKSFPIVFVVIVILIVLTFSPLSFSAAPEPDGEEISCFDEQEIKTIIANNYRFALF
jgi:hypothetical protein